METQTLINKNKTKFSKFKKLVTKQTKVTDRHNGKCPQVYSDSVCIFCNVPIFTPLLVSTGGTTTLSVPPPFMDVDIIVRHTYLWLLWLTNEDVLF